MPKCTNVKSIYKWAIIHIRCLFHFGFVMFHELHCTLLKMFHSSLALFLQQRQTSALKNGMITFRDKLDWVFMLLLVSSLLKVTSANSNKIDRNRKGTKSEKQLRKMRRVSRFFSVILFRILFILFCWLILFPFLFHNIFHMCILLLVLLLSYDNFCLINEVGCGDACRHHNMNA